MFWITSVGLLHMYKYVMKCIDQKRDMESSDLHFFYVIFLSVLSIVHICIFIFFLLISSWYQSNNGSDITQKLFQQIRMRKLILQVRRPIFVPSTMCQILSFFIEVLEFLLLLNRWLEKITGHGVELCLCHW